MDESCLEEFVKFAQQLKGDEKGDAQVFLERLFQALGHVRIIEAGATLEHRIKIDDRTKFADLLWPGRDTGRGRFDGLAGYRLVSPRRFVTP